MGNTGYRLFRKDIGKEEHRAAVGGADKELDALLSDYPQCLMDYRKDTEWFEQEDS